MHANRSVVIVLVALTVAVVVGGCKNKQQEAKMQDQDRAESAVSPSTKASDIGKYGFRYDPMKWVQMDKTLQGALVRTRVFHRPQAGDEEIIQAHIEKRIAEQKPDGTIGSVYDLLELGCSPERPEIQRAVAAHLAKPENKDGTLGVYQLHTACLAGGADKEVILASLRDMSAKVKKGLHGGCPWTPVVHMNALYAGRHLYDVRPAITAELKYIAANLSEACYLGYKEPWALIDTAAHVEYPEARDVIIKMLPLILRGQKPDGGWGYHSRGVFAALKKFGLLAELAKRSPLPADWKIVRSIPAPEKSLARRPASK